MSVRSEQTLTEFLTTDPELLAMKKRYRELTGQSLVGYNWDEFRGLDHYLSCLRRMVAEVEVEMREAKESGRCPKAFDMSEQLWEILQHDLETNPELLKLKQRYYKLTGQALPEFIWENYIGWDQYRSPWLYLATMHRLVDEAEAKIKEETTKS